MKRTMIFAGLLALGISLGAPAASAQTTRGVAISVQDVGAQHRQALLTRIAKARAANPAVFQKVATYVAQVPKLDAEKRGRFASVTRPLKALGQSGIEPMLEMLAVKGPARGNMTDTAWSTVRVSLIEAVGMQRDASTVPVLDAIVDTENDFWVVRAAAEALGRIGTDASAKKLVQMASTSGPRQRAVLSGIGDCRRSVCASGVAGLLSSGKLDYDKTQLAIRALGDMGNAWAWQTPVVKKSGEEASVRSLAAKTLVDAFVRHHRDDTLRVDAQKAILIVDDPATPGLIEAAKSGASPALAQRLDQLKQKFANSPLHKYN